MTLLPQSAGCFVCGAENPIGLKLVFVRDQHGVFTRFVGSAEHCGYAGIVHGGIIATLLDETLGWAASVVKRWYFVTADLKVRFKVPLPAAQEVVVRGRYLCDKSRFWMAEGEISDEKGVVYATASGLYAPAPVEQHEQFLEQTVARYGTSRQDPFGGSPITAR